MSERSDTSRWLSEDAALGVLELSRGAGRELLNKGWLQPQQDGIFREAEIVEATILKHIRPSLGRSSEASNTWTALRKDGTVGGIVQLALSEDAALRRRLVFIDLTEELNARLTAFCRRANRGPVPASRRGRPRKTADVHALPLRATSS